MASLRNEYLTRALGSFGLAAARLALDLSRGDDATLKDGYTPDNAVLAALEIFPEADEDAIRALNDWGPFLTDEDEFDATRCFDDGQGGCGYHTAARK